MDTDGMLPVPLGGFCGMCCEWHAALTNSTLRASEVAGDASCTPVEALLVPGTLSGHRSIYGASL